MRWYAGTIILIALLPTMAQANTCPAPSSQSSLFWSAAPFLLLAIYGAILLWLWWTRPPAGVAFDRDDPEKIAATNEARRTLPQFWNAFDNPATDECDFAVKFNLNPEEDAEFIWAFDLKREDGRIYGKLGNEPIDPGYSPDEFYEINPDDIVDWTYYKAGVAQGHFVTRVMFKHMPKRFVRQAERELGWAQSAALDRAQLRLGKGSKTERCSEPGNGLAAHHPDLESQALDGQLLRRLLLPPKGSVTA